MSQQFSREHAQTEHELRAIGDPDHDLSACVCCCGDCADIDVTDPEHPR